METQNQVVREKMETELTPILERVPNMSRSTAQSVDAAMLSHQKRLYRCLGYPARHHSDGLHNILYFSQSTMSDRVPPDMPDPLVECGGPWLSTRTLTPVASRWEITSVVIYMTKTCPSQPESMYCIYYPTSCTLSSGTACCKFSRVSSQSTLTITDLESNEDGFSNPPLLQTDSTCL